MSRSSPAYAAVGSHAAVAAATSSPAATVAAWLIGIYQRYISPWKGFRCAHRAWHGRHSCSEYVKRVALKRGFWAAYQCAQRRFRRCREAKEKLTERLRRLGRRGEVLMSTGDDVQARRRRAAETAEACAHVGQVPGECCCDPAVFQFAGDCGDVAWAGELPCECCGGLS